MAVSYHGNVQHQCRNHDARPKVNKSVKTAAPFWYNNPPTAGNMAKMTGLDSHWFASSKVVVLA
jgi:hypothetical protein